MNLDVIKAVLPDFDMKDFHMFDQIISFKWETVFDSESWEEHGNVVLEMTGPDNYKILMECKDVGFLRFQGKGHISGFYIKDMSVRGYENCCRYQVGDYDYGSNEFEFYCSDIMIRSLEKT